MRLQGSKSIKQSVRSLAALGIGLVLCLPMAIGRSFGQTPYQKPPDAVLDVLNAPIPPRVTVSPTQDYILMAQGVRYPSIADLAQPMLRLAGLRINPSANGPHQPPRTIALTLKKIDGGRETKIPVPPNAYLSLPVWSADGKHFAFTNTVTQGIELWVGDTATGQARRIDGVQVNGVLPEMGFLPGAPFRWMPDQRTLLVRTIPSGRGKPPAAPPAPKGPNIQESTGKTAPIRTYQDMLTGSHDEDLFDYYATAQLTLVDIVSRKRAPVGKPAIFATVEPAPDGQHLLVARVQRPYSYLHPAMSFPKEVEVWNRAGAAVHKLASLPLADQVPIEGVPTGPRSYHWRPIDTATLVWVEALDGGDPRKKVSPRDRVLMLKAPFQGQPEELARTQHRFFGLTWGERDGVALIRDYDRDRRWGRTFIMNADQPGQTLRVVWDRSVQDRYNDPGTPIMRRLPNGHIALRQQADWIFLAGAGATREGDRPFLDRLSLKTLKTERLFRSGADHYENVIALLNEDGTRVITEYESPSEPPNYYMRTLAAGAPAEKRALTQFPDPAPSLRRIKKQLVTYKRADGVPLSFTLYLPPDYKEGARLPTVVWAYPREFNDADTAGQVVGSTQRFTNISGMSHLFFLLQGYAILDNTTMPVVGDPETMNNTYIEQIVASAKAAIDKAVAMGVTDPNRVGVGGHSYGAFMTANLLAHSDLFRAGIARSGAYNRTLTPFGFQTERRTLWEAPELYLKVSPFMYAHKIKTPILLIHGEADNNSGTFPIQSERFYQALSGNGGTVRYVTLPHESHGYAARESIEHTLYEMIDWFKKYVKNAPSRGATAAVSESRR